MKNRIFTILLCLSGFLFLCGLLQKEGWLSAEKIVIPRPCFKYENEKFLIFEYDYVWRDWSLTRSISKWDELLDFLPCPGSKFEAPGIVSGNAPRHRQ